MTRKPNPVNILMILDGWGINDNSHGNAFSLARTPCLDSFLQDYPSCRLLCSGNAVGLPEGTMGNSEVGHMNIGAGRKVLQHLVRINQAIEDRTFFQNSVLSTLMTRVAHQKKSLHIMGLLSDSGVHSHISHLFALIDMAKQRHVDQLYIHAILDGRDTSPTSGITYIKQLRDYLDTCNCGKIATLVGRYWAMDRDTRWDRIEKAYALFTEGTGILESDPVEAVQKAYDAGQTDEFIKPIIIRQDSTKNPALERKVSDTAESAAARSIPEGIVADGDGMIFFNFRADRAKEITRAFNEPEFTAFKRKRRKDLAGFVCMTQYEEDFDLPVAFGTEHLNRILGEILSQNHIPQLRIAETEKYAHVTYFFNGGDEKIFDGEKRILIPSPRDVATYDEKPEMSAFEVADKACEKIKSQEFEFIILNFANMDMVGHTGILEAAIKACETVDTCVQKVVGQIHKTGGVALITADHGNSEQMIAEDGSPHTAHTLNPVRLILAGEKFKGLPMKNGILGDIAPTILKILDIEQPSEMTGKALI